MSPIWSLSERGSRNRRGRSPAVGIVVPACGAVILLLAACAPEGEGGARRTSASGDGPVNASAGTAGPESAGGSVEAIPLTRELAGVDSGADETLFERLESGVTGVDFCVRWDDPGRHIKQFLLMNPVGGICAGDFDGDGLADFYITSPSGSGRLFRNEGGFRFEDVTEACGLLDESLWGTGASFVDIDGDGDLDLAVCAYDQPNRLYRNDGSGAAGEPARFTDVAGEIGLGFRGASMMLSFADADLDGDLDAYLATTGLPPPEGTQFRVNFVTRDDGVEMPIIPDELKEFWEMLYLPGDRAQRVEAAQFDRFFRNDGGRFVDATKESGIEGPHFTLSATWWDYDEDGDPDIYVSNDFTGPDRLYRNRGDGTFEDVIREVVPHTPWFSMGSDVADLNNDGRLDFVATDMSATTHYRDKIGMGNMDDMGWFLEWAEPRQYMRNAVYLNTGTGRMLEAAFLMHLASTDWTWTPRLEDFDNDGFVDAFFTNGVVRDTTHSDLTQWADQNLRPGSQEYIDFWVKQPLRPEKNLAFRNHGGLHFEKSGAEWGLDREGVTFGAATADFDNDGDLDLVTSDFDAPVGIYRNRSREGNVIQVRLVGAEGNRQALGARVVATTPVGRVHARSVALARGWLSSPDTILHIGLGEETAVAELVVHWPGGARQALEDLAANHRYVITQGAAGPAGESVTPPAGPEPFFERADGLFAAATHRENDYDDFAVQPLLPNRMSRLGPGMAWGDVDGDGDPDAYFGGARGEAGVLLLSDGGSFTPAEEAAFASNKYSEDMGALFVDVDGDLDLDLFVVSGGAEFSRDDIFLRDHLYLNDGSGDFSEAPTGMLPDLRDSGSCAAAVDYDRDGDLDLFVGSRQVPGEYPVAPVSRLLRNDGGRFVDAAPPALGGAGMVTAAVWSDINDDGWPDLAVATDWGPVRIFRNSEGRLAEATEAAGLAGLSGWWNGIASGDLDGDGDVDFAVTNFGRNTKYHPSESKPELLFYGDFDGTGKANLVEAKFEGDVCLPRRGFSCSSSAMPFLRGKVQTFHNFASSDLVGLYSEERLDDSLRLEAVTLDSGILRNDGGGRFRFEPLPALAQIAPAFGVAIADLGGDGHPDLVLAQNFFSPQRETGRMDGGLSLYLEGRGDGTFHPVPALESGIVLPVDAAALAPVDLDGDLRPDLVFTVNNGEPVGLLNRRGDLCVAVRLDPSAAAGEPVGIVPGARVRVLRADGSAAWSAELAAGGSYLAQACGTLFIPRAAFEAGARIEVRWPDGARTEHDPEASDGGVLVLRRG